jgi:hypothetical protein
MARHHRAAVISEQHLVVRLVARRAITAILLFAAGFVFWWSRVVRRRPLSAS